MNKYSYDGIFLGFCTILITGIFELFNKNSASKIINEQGISLYIDAWQLSTLNSIFYGPIIYFYVTNNFIDNYTNHNYIANIFNINGLLIIHSFCYYIAHIIMHYKYFFFMHEFHHKFSNNVSPVIAMSVSIYEYLFAYMLPFIVGSYIFNPNTLELNSAASVVSVFNIIIHTPSLENIKYYKFFVSPYQHLKHHKIMTKHFSAPTYNLDYISSIFFKNKSCNISTKNDVNDKLNNIRIPKSIKI